ncbi:hypothetical protein K1719_016325 [Acacia pycnantha]|nr:hypothetical protein K1719_016325 [Acacia pycnantha]
MSKMAVHCDAPFLPEDIMVNILKRLPVKSLIRFQCVCKHWKNFLKTSSFVTDHLHYSSAQNPSLLFKPNSNCQPLHLSLIDGEINALEVQIPPLIGSLSDVMIVGSSNGLLCIATNESKDSLLYWNPAIREVRQVPATTPSKFPLSYCILGFGFSEIVDDYKIVKTYTGRGNVIIGVKMYSLSTDSWKNIEFGSLEGLELLNFSVIVNGVIFWSALDSGYNWKIKKSSKALMKNDFSIKIQSSTKVMPQFFEFVKKNVTSSIIKRNGNVSRR